MPVSTKFPPAIYPGGNNHIEALIPNKTKPRPQNENPYKASTKPDQSLIEARPKPPQTRPWEMNSSNSIEITFLSRAKTHLKAIKKAFLIAFSWLFPDSKNHIANPGNVAPAFTPTSTLNTAIRTICAILLLSALPLPAQTAPPAQRPTFDVASVKPVADEGTETAPKRSGGRITWTTDLSYLITYAWHFDFRHMSGAIPRDAPNYRVEATTDPAATDDQIRLMFQALLQDRFKLETHRVTKDEDGYALTIAKGGPRIKEFRADDPPPPLPAWEHGLSVDAWEGHIAASLPEPGVAVIIGRRVSILQLTEVLRRVLPLMVWDQTGLTGKYYFALRYARDASPDIDAPTIESALKDNLGLELKNKEARSKD